MIRMPPVPGRDLPIGDRPSGDAAETGD